MSGVGGSGFGVGVGVGVPGWRGVLGWGEGPRVEGVSWVGVGVPMTSA